MLANHVSAPFTNLPLKQRAVFVLTLAFLFCLCYFPFLDLLPLIKEETRRALVARELLENNNYLVTTIGGELYTAKPPLYNWLIMFFSGMNSENINEFNARLTSVAAVAALAVWMCFITRNWWSTNCMLFFAILVIFSPAMVRKGTFAEIDMFFTLLVNLSLFSWFIYYQRGQMNKAWLISAVFIGLAYLCKREAALLFYLLSTFGWLFYRHKLRQSLNIGVLFAGLIIVAFIASWIVPIILAYDLSVFSQQTARQIALRQNDGSLGNYLLSSIFYPVEVAAALLPGFLIMPIMFLKKYRRFIYRKYGEKFTYCWFLMWVNIIPYILLGDSNVRYYMPMFPAIFIMITMVFSRMDSMPAQSLFRKTISFFVPALLLVLMIIALLFISKVEPLNDVAQIGFVIIIIFMCGYLIRLYRAFKAPYTGLDSKLAFEFILFFCLALRFTDFSYSLPRKLAKTLEERDIISILHDVKQQASGRIIAFPQFSHGFLFYDKDKLITPTNCGDEINNDDLHLHIISGKTYNSAGFQTASEIVWTSDYEKGKKVVLLKAEQTNGRFTSYFCPN